MACFGSTLDNNVLFVVVARRKGTIYRFLTDVPVTDFI